MGGNGPVTYAARRSGAARDVGAARQRP